MKPLLFAMALGGLLVAGCAAPAQSPKPSSVTPPRAETGLMPFGSGTAFQEAWNAIHAAPPNYAQALDLLEAEIAQYPGAGNLDYPYGWATLCLAHLGQYDRCLEYYAIMRSRFYGFLRTGANGANRNWDDVLQQARDALAGRDDPRAREVLAQMLKLDQQAREQLLTRVSELIRRASAGDRNAMSKLRQEGYPDVLLDLIEDGKLKLAE